MSNNRLGLSPEAADRFLVTWAADDLAAGLKQALKVRKFRLRLDYTSHTPMLFIVRPDGKEFLWHLLDTRKYRPAVVVLPDKEPTVRAFGEHVDSELAKLGFRMLIGHRRKGSHRDVKKDEAILMLVSNDSRHWVLSVLNVPKGATKTIAGEVE